MGKSQLSESLRAEKKAYRKNIIDSICNEISNAAKKSSNGKVPYGFINKLIEQSVEEEPCINWNLINFAYKKFCQKVKSLEQTVKLQTSTKKNEGRPKISTDIRKHHLKEVVLAAKNEIVKLYLEEKDKYNKQGKRLSKNGLMKKL